MVKNKDMQFCMENLKMKRKRTHIFLTFQSRDLNPRFSLPWFEFQGDKNKSALPSKIFPTLQSLITWYYVLFISCIILPYCIKGKAELETWNVKSWLKFLRLPKSEWVYNSVQVQRKQLLPPPISCSGI